MLQKFQWIDIETDGHEVGGQILCGKLFKLIKFFTINRN